MLLQPIPRIGTVFQMKYLSASVVMGLLFVTTPVYAASVSVDPLIFESCEADSDVTLTIADLPEGYVFINFAPNPVEAERVWYGAYQYDYGEQTDPIGNIFQYGDCSQLALTNSTFYGDWIFAVISTTTQEGSCGSGSYSDCEADILEEYTVTISPENLPECDSGNPIADAVCNERNEIADEMVLSVAGSLDEMFLLFGGLGAIGLSRRVWIKFIGRPI